MEKVQQQILKHHGGDGDKARENITKTYFDRHDQAFWDFWQEKVALDVKAGESIIDLGAGTGLFIKDIAERYPAAKAIGFEAAPYMLEQLVDLPQNAVIYADDLNEPCCAGIDKVEIANNSVAAAMCNLVVHELIQPVLLFQSVYRWLKPGGRFCIIDLVRQPLEDYLKHTYPNVELKTSSLSRESLEDAFEHFLEHNRYHATDLIYMLTAVGFKLVDQARIRNGRMIRLVVEK